ncbi:MAG TPA: TatD family hydrolase [Gammaproteobacteria bacterium]|nr:TatD family hydrolase [Gammaproteobacteria bacterium]
MSKLIDSHCHLHCLPLEKMGVTLEEVISKAKQAGIDRMISVSIDAKSFPEVLAVANRFPEVFASSGVHPCDIKDLTEADWLIIEEGAQMTRVVAIGETGLDYYHTGRSQATEQKKAFRRHIELAKKERKPLIIHTRDAREDTLSILKENNASELGGVMHCFTETLEMAKAALDMNFYISFSGIITFKNAREIQEVVKQVPLERILVETDAPYLAPVPYRGKVNQPAYVYHVAEQVALLKGLSLEKVIQQTTANCQKLFKL